MARRFLIGATDPLAEGWVVGVGVWIDEGRRLLWWGPLDGATEAQARRMPAYSQKPLRPSEHPDHEDDAWYEFREALAELGEGRERWGDDGTGVDSFKRNPAYKEFSEEKERVLTRVAHFERKWRLEREKEAKG